MWGRFNQSSPSVDSLTPPPVFQTRVRAHLRSNPPQSSFSLIPQPTTSTREMSGAPGTRSLTPIHVDSERLVPVPPKKLPLPSVFSRLASVVRQYPFSSTILLYLCLAGGIAGATKSSYNRDNREVGWPDDKPYRNVDRVSSSVSLTLVGFDLTRYIIDRTHRT